ncbi:hypothetical protein GN956_G22908 [Arapaima gigas]
MAKTTQELLVTGPMDSTLQESPEGRRGEGGTIGGAAPGDPLWTGTPQKLVNNGTKELNFGLPLRDGQAGGPPVAAVRSSAAHFAGASLSRRFAAEPWEWERERRRKNLCKQENNEKHPVRSAMTSSAPDLSFIIPPQTLRRLAQEWLAEDTPNFDPAGLCVGSREVRANLLCKTPGSVLAGCPFFTAVFTELGCSVEWLHCEGHTFGSDAVTKTAVVKGPARCVLLGERPALNCLARTSGIATGCRKLIALAKHAGWTGQVAGTRKTTPGFRLAEKYAMLVGGVSTHRQDLSGMVMLKDNHIWASGSITQAVRSARSVCGFSSKIEVECGSKEEAAEAAAAGADVVMLDNFTPEGLHAAARSLKQEFPFVLVEGSGGLTPQTLPLYFSPHVDIISLGCITQGCPAVDFSLKIEPKVAV